MKDCNNKKFIFLSATALIVILLIVFAPYIYTFEKYGLSDKHQAWANFGGYVGGILGPALSAIAFIVIWRTYLLQQSQHEFIEKQASINLLNEQINSTSNALDDRLSRTYEHNNKNKALQYILRDKFMTGIIGESFYDGESDVNEIVIEDAIKEVESLLELLTIYVNKQKEITEEKYDFTLILRRFTSTISYIESNKTLNLFQYKMM